MNEEKCRKADISHHKSSKTRAEADKLRSKEEAEALSLKVCDSHPSKQNTTHTFTPYIFICFLAHNCLKGYNADSVLYLSFMSGFVI